MAADSSSDIKFEIGHVIFIDIVGYSKLLLDEQKERLRQLTDIVLATPQVSQSTNEQLVRLPTGDGMALVFRNSSEEPARCALEMAGALKACPEVLVRMGINPLLAQAACLPVIVVLGYWINSRVVFKNAIA